MLLNCQLKRLNSVYLEHDQTNNYLSAIFYLFEIENQINKQVFYNIIDSKQTIVYNINMKFLKAFDRGYHSISGFLIFASLDSVKILYIFER